MRILLAWVGGIALAGGCGPKVGEEDEAEGSGTGDSGEASAETSVETSSTPTTTPGTTSTTTVGTFPDESGEVDVDSGPKLDVDPLACDNPNFQCSTPLDCMQWNCGGVEAPVDENGCLRPSCGDDSDCFGDVCFRPSDWGFCSGSGTFCQDDPRSGVCQCTSDPDCGGAYCLPADQAPPQTCDFAQADACASAGCQPMEGRPILPAGQGCACDLEDDYCLWWPDDANVQNFTTVYMHWETLEVVAFPLSIDPPPLGWVPCDEVPFPPPECICAENLPCAMG